MTIALLTSLPGYPMMRLPDLTDALTRLRASTVRNLTEGVRNGPDDQPDMQNLEPEYTTSLSEMLERLPTLAVMWEVVKL